MTDGTHEGEAELEALRRRVADLERFTRRVAHELATPLTSASGFARLLLDRGGHDAETTDGLQRIARATSQAAELVRSHLDGAVDAAPQHVGLRRLLRAAADPTFGRAAAVGDDVPHDLVVFGPPGALREAAALLVRAAATRLVEQDADTELVQLSAVPLGPDVVAVTCVVQVPAPLVDPTGLRTEIEADQPVLAVLRQLQVVLQGLGGRLWTPAPAAPPDHFSFLVQLPRGEWQHDGVAGGRNGART